MLFANAQAVSDKIKALAKDYGAALPGRMKELETLARPLSAERPFEEIRQSLHEVCSLAHRIAGTAGTFGYQSVTDHARAIEESLRPVIKAERTLSVDEMAATAGRIEVLKELASAKPHW